MDECQRVKEHTKTVMFTFVALGHLVVERSILPGYAITGMAA
jgi:hypothetical protein